MSEELLPMQEEVSQNKNVWEKVKGKWETMTTAQKAYVGSIALLVGVNLADLVTTTMIDSLGGTEVGLCKSVFDVAGIAGFQLLKVAAVAGAIPVIDKVIKPRAEKMGMEKLTTASVVAMAAVTVPAVISNTAQLINYYK